MKISVIDPISRAFQRAILMTFKPFNIGKWFALGFIAWLATLGEGANFPSNSGGGGGRPGPTSAPTTGSWTTTNPNFGPALPVPPEEVRNWFATHIPLVVLIGLTLVVVLVAFGLLISWLTSRGKFMFLRAVATNTAEVVLPWQQFHELGNSLFGFQVCLWGVGLAVNLTIIGTGLLIAWPDIRAHTFGGHAAIAFIVGAVLLAPSMILLGLVSWCTNSFITVIMYATGKDPFAAWREFREVVMPGNLGKLVLFLLMEILLGSALFMTRFAVGCLSCCIGFLPYLSTVIVLPLVVFMRCYSVYFLQQFGPQYAIIIESPPPPRMGFQVIGMPYPPPPSA